MDFALSDEHQMIVDTVRSFTERELFPYEDQVEKLGQVPPDLVQQIKKRSIDAGSMQTCTLVSSWLFAQM